MQTTDKFGSPSVDELQVVACDVNEKLIVKLGEELAGTVEINMSSPVRYQIVQTSALSCTVRCMLMQRVCARARSSENVCLGVSHF